MIHWKHHGIAVLVALSLHLLAAALISRPAESGARAPGEQGIEIDLGMMGDLGTASDNQDSQAEPEPVEPEPALTEQPKPTPETPAPEPKITPQAKPEPEAIQVKKVAQRPVEKKKEPPQPIPREPQPEASQPSVAPTEQTKSSQTQRKQSTGSSNSLTTGGSPAAVRSYYSLIAAQLARHKRYPISSRRRGEEGIVDVSFTLSRSGSLQAYRIVVSSGHKRLDQAVIRMLKQASPLPPLPDSITGPELTIRIPIEFRLNH